MLTSDDVARLAALARIELSDEELAHLAPQMSLIVDSVAGLSEAIGPDILPTSHAVPMTNVMRDDVPEVVDADFLVLVQAGAPSWEDGRFRVPRILEDEA